jgi:hypothetical protein
MLSSNLRLYYSYTLTYTTNQQNRNSRYELLEGSGGYSLIDRKQNEDIKKELHVTDVITRIKDCQTKWREQVERMEGQRIAKILFKYNVAGKRDQGKLQKRWRDQFLI